MENFQFFLSWSAFFFRKNRTMFGELYICVSQKKKIVITRIVTNFFSINQKIRGSCGIDEFRWKRRIYGK